MRTLKIDPRNPDHINGPYLLFARSNLEFSDHHEFEDWEFLDNGYSGKMWGRNSVLSLVNSKEEFRGAGDIPEWVDFFEIASISTEFGQVPFAEPSTDYSDLDALRPFEYVPSSSNLVWALRPRGVIEKRTFGRRLLIVAYADEDSLKFITEHNERIKGALGVGSAVVWHSSDIFGFSFVDDRSPQAIVDSLKIVLNEKSIYDAAIFRVAAVLSERGKISPFEHFISS